jgi:hypothetical protein
LRAAWLLGSAGLSLALVGAGCGGDGGDGATAVGQQAQRDCSEVATLSLNPPEVAPGEAIAVAVENNSIKRQTITFGLGGELDRATDDGWVKAPEAQVSQPVPDLAVVVKPGQSSSTRYGATADVIELSPEAPAGSYRVVKEVSLSGKGATAATLCARFRVS